MKKDMRIAFAERLQYNAKKNPEIMVVVSDSRGSASMGGFYKAMPERFVEVGIAEQNSIGVAAGLSLVGKQPFACGPASFLMMRSQEQVKTDVAYSNTNVKIIGISAGVSYAVLGATHHALGDIAAARLMPGLAVLVPSDAAQAAAMADFLSLYKGPAYLRMGRGSVEDIYNPSSPENNCFTFGKANVLKEGSDILMCACGELVYPALRAAEVLEGNGIRPTVLDISTIRPFDNETVRKYAKDSRLIVTIEEHFKAGGLGDEVSMSVWDFGKRVLRLGMEDEYMICASSDEIKKECGLDCAGIVKSITENL